jgi:hypothetical protein
MIYYWKIDYEETRGNYDKAREVLAELQNQESIPPSSFLKIPNFS